MDPYEVMIDGVAFTVYPDGVPTEEFWAHIHEPLSLAEVLAMEAQLLATAEALAGSTSAEGFESTGASLS